MGMTIAIPIDDKASIPAYVLLYILFVVRIFFGADDRDNGDEDYWI